MTFHALKWRDGKLDLSERIDPRDDEATVRNDGDASLSELVREPACELVSRFAVECPRARQGAVEPKAGDQTWIPLVSPAK